MAKQYMQELENNNSSEFIDSPKMYPNHLDLVEHSKTAQNLFYQNALSSKLLT